MNNVFTRGIDFYKYGPNPYDDRPDRETNFNGGFKYEHKYKGAYLNSVLSSKLTDHPPKNIV